MIDQIFPHRVCFPIWILQMVSFVKADISMRVKDYTRSAFNRKGPTHLFQRWSCCLKRKHPCLSESVSVFMSPTPSPGQRYFACHPAAWLMIGIQSTYQISDSISLQWRHNDHDDVWNHQPHECLLNRLFRHRSKKTSKLRVTGLCAGNSPGPVNSPHKWPVTRKVFSFDDVIMSHPASEKLVFDL